MKGKGLEITLWSMIVGGLTILGLLAWWDWRQQNDPMPAPSTTVTVDMSCMAVTVDVQTGLTTETPAPCQQTTEGGCTGSISFRIEENGTVTTWCNEEVNN